MLQLLSIQNYALIDHLEIDFSEGLTIITGETGAGKSILLGALSLILGQRADAQMLKDKNKKCIVEGSFKIKNYSIKEFFDVNNLDYEDLTVIRREINQAGKSRAFINDTPVSLSQIKDLAQELIDIHSQHETLTLNDSKFQLDIIDGYIQIVDIVNDFKIKFKEYKQLQQHYQVLIEKEKQSKLDLDYNQFLFDELESVNLKINEQAELEHESETLTHSEEIKSNLSKTLNILSVSDFNILVQLSEVKILISQLLKYFPDINDVNERINNINIELKDLSNEIENIESKIIYNPDRINEINNRLDSIYHLQQKHRVSSIEELIDVKNQISDKLLLITSLEVEIIKLKSEIDNLFDDLLKLAREISTKRIKSFKEIQKKIESTLMQLGMPDATVIIENLISEEICETGIDKINFTFSANKGSEPKPISKIASGGELARFMLSIKSIISQKNLLPTIVFDEIDQGVSGNVADKMGVIMKQMSTSMQVVTITHLPQIASKGDVHYVVRKETVDNKAKTIIEKLSKAQRVEEIAKMLSGEELTDAAIKNAKVLLEAR